MTASKTSKIRTVQNVRSTRVIEAGPRGFRFGKAWTKQVKAVAGMAVHPTYLPKLKAHAKAVGVSAAGKDPVAIATRVAAAL
jgi:hypothetical protein